MFSNNIQSQIEKELSDMKSNGLFKVEKVVMGHPGTEIKVDSKKMINLCANNYLGTSQQRGVLKAAEKALKALYIHRKRSSIVTHNLVTLAHALDIPGAMLDAAQELNADYVTARYPDAANGIPAEQYSKEMAVRHVKAGRRILQWVKNFLR